MHVGDRRLCVIVDDGGIALRDSARCARGAVGSPHATAHAQGVLVTVWLNESVYFLDGSRLGCSVSGEHRA